MQDEEVSFLKYNHGARQNMKVNYNQLRHIWLPKLFSRVRWTHSTEFVPFRLCSCVRWRSLMESTEWSSISVRPLSLIL